MARQQTEKTLADTGDALILDFEIDEGNQSPL